MVLLLLLPLPHQNWHVFVHYVVPRQYSHVLKLHHKLLKIDHIILRLLAAHTNHHAQSAKADSKKRTYWKIRKIH